ncbi:MAG: DUF4188 domain-containing protein [Chloroflexi bacterium]|nr:DUF4188 domain-containing protein [Chloroflexota bacterium]
MAASVFNGRYTANLEGDFVVFLIGARINSWRKILRLAWIGEANSAMYRVLEANPDYGYLGGEAFTRNFFRESINITYWRSYDHLERFARSQDDPHLEAWRRFNREIASDGSFGIWHETYLVKAGNFESVYGNMPRFGLAKAAAHLPMTGRKQTARGRLTGEELSAPADVVTY